MLAEGILRKGLFFMNNAKYSVCSSSNSRPGVGSLVHSAWGHTSSPRALTTRLGARCRLWKRNCVTSEKQSRSKAHEIKAWGGVRQVTHLPGKWALKNTYSKISMCGLQSTPVQEGISIQCNSNNSWA